MDPLSSFLERLGAAWAYLTALFAAGFAVALWDPHPKAVLTLALGISLGMLLLGPYSAAALYSTKLQARCGGHLRWPVCLLLALSTVFLLDYVLVWTLPQFVLAGATACLGTVFGHDATLAVLELRAQPRARVDPWMVSLFPLIVGLAVLAGYCSLGFALGTYHLLAALLG